MYYTPETRWVFGAGGATNFNLGDSTATYESQAVFGVAYSLRKQFLSYANWRIFTDQNKNLLSGEVGWYDYVYFFSTASGITSANQIPKLTLPDSPEFDLIMQSK